jgi:hypothetical protein
MFTNQPPIPTSITEAFGRWLADQEWSIAPGGEDESSWVMNENRDYLVESITSDSEGRAIPPEEMEHVLTVMQSAPRMLRFILRGLEIIDDATLNDSTKVEHMQLLLSEVAGQTLRTYGTPLDVARAVQERQASRGDEDEEDEE